MSMLPLLLLCVFCSVGFLCYLSFFLQFSPLVWEAKLPVIPIYVSSDSKLSPLSKNETCDRFYMVHLLFIFISLLAGPINPLFPEPLTHSSDMRTTEPAL